MAEKSEVLRFFRPLMSNFSAKLLIPAPIAEHISKAKSRDKVTLVNPNCKMWHVDLHTENKTMYLGGKSWQNFVQDNKLEIGQLLFFKYRGNMVLTFRIYDLSSCERTLSKNKIANGVIDVEDCTPEEVGGHRTKKRAQEVESTSNATHAAGSNKKMRGGEDLMASKAALTPLIDKNGKEVYFEVELTYLGLNRDRQYVPAAFKECSGLSGMHTKFLIIDLEGLTWLVDILHERNGSIYISKGWFKLSHENQLKAGDKLRFVLVSVKGTTVHLNMFKL